MVAPKPEMGNRDNMLGVAALPQYIEFPGACPGCGETPYLRLVASLYGRHMIVAAATGCNTIYAGSYPSVPFCADRDGRGPAWHNSLFEDGAEFGFGMTTAYEHARSEYRERVRAVLERGVDDELAGHLRRWLDVFDDVDESNAVEDAVRAWRDAHADAVRKDADLQGVLADEVVSYLGKDVHWIFGGDGWAYDIGYGGLDHVLATGRDVNVLVLDTEVYSNTGGQASKATPFGASAKFAIDGKKTLKKDLGMIAMTYGNIYVASIALHANRQQAINAIKAAVAYKGPSVVICNCPCIEHHYVHGMSDVVHCQRLSVDTGAWLLYSYNPALLAENKNPFKLDSVKPYRKIQEYLNTQNRFLSVIRSRKGEEEAIYAEIQKHIDQRFKKYQNFVGFCEGLLDN